MRVLFRIFIAEENTEVKGLGETADKLRYGLTGGSVRTEILGREKLILEGCDGIIAYTEEEIGFRCGRRQIWVRGESLRMICIDADSAVLGGRIGEVSFR